MISAALDKSGNKYIGNRAYMSFIMGTKKYLDSIIKLLEHKKIHMSQIRNKEEQDHIISKLNFDNKESIALCIKINQDEILDRIKKMKKVKNKNIPNNKIYRAYNHAILYNLREKIAEFLIMHKHALSDIVFQCDDDCIGFVKDNGLQHDKEDYMQYDL